MLSLNRELAKLKAGQFILAEGNGTGTRYRVHFNGLIKADVDPEIFFKTDVITERSLNDTIHLFSSAFYMSRYSRVKNSPTGKIYRPLSS